MTPEHPLERLNPSNRTLERAQYEDFEFELVEAGVIVRNMSHDEPRDHEYVVTIDDGLPDRCECLGDEHHSGPCKHRVAIAIRPAVLEKAIDVQRIRDCS